MNKREQILTDNIWRLMIRLSLPGILGMIVISVNGLVDAFFVSHMVGPDAFAGVSCVMPLLTINSALIALLSAGSASLYSRAIGANDDDLLNRLFTHLMFAIVMAVALIMIFGFFVAPYVLKWLDVPINQIFYAQDFYHVSITGVFFPVFGLCTSALIRAEGHAGKAMKITALAMIINALINPLLIKQAGLGIKGSALASIISMIIYSAFTLKCLAKKETPIKLKWAKVDHALLKAIVLTGLPTFYMQANGFFRQLILFKLVTYTAGSPKDVSVFSGIYRLFSFAAIPMFGMLQALGPLVGINYGAGQSGRSRQAVVVFRTCAIVFLLPVVLTGLLFPKQILSLLLTDPSLVAAGVNYFRLVIIVLLLMPFASGSIVFLQSTGQSKIASKFTLSREAFIFLPVIAIAVYIWGYQGIYIGLLLENLVYINVVYWCARRYVINMPAFERTT